MDLIENNEVCVEIIQIKMKQIHSDKYRDILVLIIEIYDYEDCD